VRGLRIGLPTDAFFWEDTEIDVVNAVRAAVDQMGRLGMKVVDVQLPQTSDALRAAGIISLADAAAYHRERLAAEPERFGADVRARLEYASRRSAVDYAQARQTGREWRRALGALFEEQADVLALPTTPVAAHEITKSEGVSAAKALLRFTYPFSLSGYPALSMPCGFTRDGLPVGLQLVGPETDLLLRVAYSHQQVTDWHERHPAI